MNKLLWVLLPLLLVTAWLAWLAWRGRLPARLGLNVLFSLLLLVYLGTTAGLGIFWVANQHLPVFDWHYLFGYATVLLLVVHLVFNFRVVWRYLATRRGAAKPQPDLARGRVSLLASTALLAAVGGGYWLGLRHGRTELRIDAASGTGSDTAWAVVERFHEFSSHSRAGVFRRAPGVNWGDVPAPFKSYPGRPVLALPPPLHTGAATPTLHLQSLATLLWHGAAVNLQRGSIHFRTSPSSGALFATELYVASGGVTGLPPGLWHYDGQSHRLHRLSERTPTAGELGASGSAAAWVLASAVFRRSGHKYGDRAYRYVLADLGHLLENLRVAAAALSLPMRLLPAFDEATAAKALALDQVEEGVLALMAFLPESADVISVSALAPVPAESTALGVTEAIHRATSWRPETGPRSSAAPAPAPSGATSRAPAALPLPPPQSHTLAPLVCIAQRRSIRRYSAALLPAAALSALLDAAARRQGPLLSGAVRVHVLTHAVQGLPPAAWRYDATTHRLLRSGAAPVPRTASRQAALDQDVVGDAAAVFVLTLHRASLLADPFGAARGYRHAFIEAGLLGERLYLEGTALGLGVCGVGAFYDDEAAALLGTPLAEEWPVHFVAVGLLG
jgi:SagB-type dehydrogenase family enzyme